MPSVSGVVRSLGDCAWLDAARARAYARILLAVTLIGAVGWIALSSGGLDRQAKPIGTDFVGFYTASQLALDGRPNLAYNVGVHWAAQRALFGSKVATPRSSIRRPRSWSVCRWRSRPTSFRSRSG